MKAGNMFMNVEKIFSKLNPANNQKVTYCDI